MKYVGIIPLIGGMDLAHQNVYGHDPEYLVSWTPFAANDSHLVHYYKNVQGKDIPYVVVDGGEGQRTKRPRGKIDVVHSTCPCAGLSMLSRTAGADNPLNDWMVTAAEYVMGDMKPTVYWGENAPALASKMGAPVREKIKQVGKKYGYSMSLYRTKSLYHGVPQIRERSFYFFWKGNKVPKLNYYRQERPTIEDVILNAKGNTFTELVRPHTPSEDPYYRFVLEELNGGMSHRTFSATLVKSAQVLDFIEQQNPKDLQKVWKDLGAWMKDKGYERESAGCYRTAEKLKTGGIMRRSVTIPRDYMGAFVGHLPTAITHPIQDRYLNYRECMAIMGLPNDFELLNPKKSLNHICQNVPVPTATDLAREVKEALEGKRDWIKASYMLQSNHKQTEILSDEDNVQHNTVEEIFA